MISMGLRDLIYVIRFMYTRLAQIESEVKTSPNRRILPRKNYCGADWGLSPSNLLNFDSVVTAML